MINVLVSQNILKWQFAGGNGLDEVAEPIFKKAEPGVFGRRVG
jgi:hypothetical protein